MPKLVLMSKLLDNLSNGFDNPIERKSRLALEKRGSEPAL